MWRKKGQEMAIAFIYDNVNNLFQILHIEPKLQYILMGLKNFFMAKFGWTELGLAVVWMWNHLLMTLQNPN